VRDGDAVIGSLELMRRGSPFGDRERVLARSAAAGVALARRAYGEAEGAHPSAHDLLEVAGDALAAGSDEARAADQVAALAVAATGASAALVWMYEPDGPMLAALSGPASRPVPATAHEAVERAQAVPGPVAGEPLSDDGGWLATLRLGQPPLGALQLAFPEEPDPALVERLSTFAVRAAHALRASERIRTLAQELERSQALLTIVGQAIAELSLAHTLETAVERVCELLDAERLAVYLVEGEDERLEPAAERGLAGPHIRVGERLLELALGPARGRGLLLVPPTSAWRGSATRWRRSASRRPSPCRCACTRT
jgi:hypothetical protein